MRIWETEKKELARRGIKPAVAEESYRPGGYPRIGLAPMRTKLSVRSTKVLKAQLERAEHQRGNTKFRALGLGEMDPRLANELASVYLGLAERFGGVKVDMINFSRNSDRAGVELAWASHVATELPGLRQAAYLLGEPDIRQVIANLHQLDEESAAAAEKDALHDVKHYYKRDITAHGGIELGECLSHPKCYGVLQSYWKMKSERRIEAGQAPRVWPSKVSVASSLLVHEFGHVVEFALKDLGEESWGHVMGVLEECLLKDENGRWVLSDYRLAKAGLTRRDARLVNYPSLEEFNRGEGAWRKEIRDVVGVPIGDMLGRYATEMREEIFAEAVLYALTAKEPWRKEKLAPFLEALWEVGLMKKRRR